MGAARVDVSRPGTAPAPAPFWGSSQKPEWKKLMELEETGQGVGGMHVCYATSALRIRHHWVGCRPTSHVPIIVGGNRTFCAVTARKHGLQSIAF